MEAVMTDFFPFMYEPKQKEFEPLPLYVELIEPPPEYKEPLSESDNYDGIIIIQL